MNCHDLYDFGAWEEAKLFSQRVRLSYWNENFSVNTFIKLRSFGLPRYLIDALGLNQISTALRLTQDGLHIVESSFIFSLEVPPLVVSCSLLKHIILIINASGPLGHVTRWMYYSVYYIIDGVHRPVCIVQSLYLSNFLTS